LQAEETLIDHKESDANR